MSAATIALAHVLSADPDVDICTLRTDTDHKLSIGASVCRLRWRQQVSTAVAADADLSTTCGALLDALAMLESLEDGDDVDRATVNVLIDRPLPSSNPSECDEALRSLRAAVVGVAAQIWYRAGERWSEDVGQPPVWPRGNDRVRGWVNDLMLPRLTTAPTEFAMQLIDAIADPSAHLYPSAIKAKSLDKWALRIDGLEIGTLGDTKGVLTLGKTGKSGDGPQRKKFVKLFGSTPVTVTNGSAKSGELTVAEAAEKIRRLMRGFRETDVVGAPLAHRAKGDKKVVDEHTLEARLLKGLVSLDDAKLVLDDARVARGSQFPTMWGTNTQARYLDAMLRRGTTPVACELKVAIGGQGRYYRRSLLQAVLYRHFIVNAADLSPWFAEAKLTQADTVAAIGIPIPARWTPRFDRDLELLRRVGSRVGVEVHVLDDRRTPDFDCSEHLAEPEAEQYERLSWRLAAALSRRWPRSLGRVLELHDAGGFYDQLQLRPVNDYSLDLCSVQPRITLNRAGSAWVFNQVGEARWTWRGIWNHLAAGGDADEAALKLGAIAGLGKPEKSTGPTFAQMASYFLELVGDPSWQWRNAWPDTGSTASWFDELPMSTAGTATAPGSLPPAARVWGAMRNDRPHVVINQDTLATWVMTDGSFKQLSGKPLDRVTKAAQQVQP